MAKVKITVLCENTVGHRVGTGEHGYSAFIETAQGNYLFDTGNGHSVVANSLVFNKDLKSIKKIILSHGHYDHTGGLSDVLKLRGRSMFTRIPTSFRIESLCLWKEKKEQNGMWASPFRGVIWNCSGHGSSSIRSSWKWMPVCL